ncbi:S-layer homology domain-containing protein, partial [Clostridiales bacterium COT073_COT-073]
KELAADFLGNYFEPMANLTREQMITILYNYAKISGKPMTQKDSLSEFADANQLEKYSETPMKWAVHQGIIKGTGANQLNPKGDISRAEVATIIQRFNELK